MTKYDASKKKREASWRDNLKQEKASSHEESAGKESKRKKREGHQFARGIFRYTRQGRCASRTAAVLPAISLV
jgi:hypothetical protein